MFLFFYIWNWTLNILVNKAQGMNLRAFMDITVKNDVTMLIKVTTHKTFKDVVWIIKDGVWIIFQFVVSLLMKDSALLPHNALVRIP